MTTVDAHHHFWDPATGDYPWMTDELAAIRRAFGPADLEPLLAANDIDATVVVQTRSSTDETRDLLRVGLDTPFVAGVVGWVDLTSPGVADEIAALRGAPGGGRLVGVRHQVHDEPDPDWLRRPDVRRGLRAVTDAGLVYDLLVRPREAPAAHDVVASLPDARFVVDHIAKPPIASRATEPWAALLGRLAKLDNVACKLSGMVTEAVWETWSADDLRPYVDRVVDMFGPPRLMFGSDWPVCLLAADYGRVVATTRALLPALTPAERERVFGATAIETYRLRVT